VPTNRSARQWVKRIGLGLITLLAAAIVAGAALQAVANWRGERQFPQEGRSVALGGDYPGITLNLNCTGTGSPTVILDSGLGLPAATWELVQRDVATFTRVCSYDRAGYGWSSELPMPRTSGAVARELHALLAASRESGPYVLVGHSFGGYNVRVYTSRYPTEVAGLVLVDASHEDAGSAQPPSMKKSDDELRATLIWQRALAPVLIRIGVARFVFPAVPLGKLSEETREKVAYLNLQSKFARAAISELEAFSQSGDEARATGAPWRIDRLSC
jgi:pimeloyl-ACP methyl ester carboxylesterase